MLYEKSKPCVGHSWGERQVEDHPWLTLDVDAGDEKNPRPEPGAMRR